MKIALCTTTIHVPHALKLMRKCSPDVRFFVAGDKNTPEEVDEFCSELLNADFFVFTPEWKCSEAIDWNTIARRNIAFLEALQWGADVIYSWDTDNIPTNPYHFAPFDGPWVFDGIGVVSVTHWFDPGSLLIPPVRHRGFPHGGLNHRMAGSVTDAKIGVMAGLVVGNPDVDATTRMELKPDIAQTHILGQTGAVVDPHTWTVFNTQNTAVIRELVPAWFMIPGVGRMDDIYASLIVQRVGRERGYHVHFGPPVCYQQRHEHNLVTDLRAEIDGYENVTRLAAILDATTLPGKSVLEDTRLIYNVLHASRFINDPQHYAAMCWLEDVEGVL